ncbi:MULTISPECIES: DUF1206 domain-containing protein [unclassified Leifsonia]|uniref:DUF1206 domain-containing protein n=1 Tax=unclassified Leifsonia TaxID=2663824 RepID=UPI000A88B812|nr:MULTISPECIES: DUF1206 domain-containing protein [unclassified Leifsonia]
MTSTAKNAARSAKDSSALKMLARLGFVVNGVLHLLIGLLAIGVAVGNGGEADQSGALQQVSSAPGGVFLLWFMVLGFAALGAWQVVAAVLPPADKNTKRAVHVVKELGKGVVYLALAGTALTFALGGSSSSSQSNQQFSAKVLAAPGGVFLILLIGLIVVGIGGYFVFKGVAAKFTEDIVPPGGTLGKVTMIVGRVGYISKGIALGIVGVLFGVAAVTHDSSKATGLDGALKSLVQLPFGVAVLIAAGIGLIFYAVYLFFRARYAKL